MKKSFNPLFMQWQGNSSEHTLPVCPSEQLDDRPLDLYQM
jgi:hypothetical protein